MISKHPQTTLVLDLLMVLILLLLSGCELPHGQADASGSDDVLPRVASGPHLGVYRFRDGDVTCWWVVPRYNRGDGGTAISCLRDEPRNREIPAA